MVPYLVLGILCMFAAFILMGWLRKQEKYVEWLPEGIDPKGKESEPYWHRTRQNRERRRKAWMIFFASSAFSFLVMWLATTFTIVRV